CTVASHAAGQEIPPPPLTVPAPTTETRNTGTSAGADAATTSAVANPPPSTNTVRIDRRRTGIPRSYSLVDTDLGNRVANTGVARLEQHSDAPRWAERRSSRERNGARPPETVSLRKR